MLKKRYNYEYKSRKLRKRIRNIKKGVAIKRLIRYPVWKLIEPEWRYNRKIGYKH